jgi:hypothetical protein
MIMQVVQRFPMKQDLVPENETTAIYNVRSRGWSVSDKTTKFVETQQ